MINPRKIPAAFMQDTTVECKTVISSLFRLFPFAFSCFLSLFVWIWTVLRFPRAPILWNQMIGVTMFYSFLNMQCSVTYVYDLVYKKLLWRFTYIDTLYVMHTTVIVFVFILVSLKLICSFITYNFLKSFSPTYSKLFESKMLFRHVIYMMHCSNV